MAGAEIIIPFHSLTMKMLERAKTEAKKKITYASKLAATAGKNELRKNTRKNFSGTLKDSYDIRLSKSGTGYPHYEVYTSERKQSKISNRRKFRYYNFGRKGFSAKGRKKLYIPMSKRGYDAYTKGNIAGLKSLKFGDDYIWKKSVKPQRGRRILQGATRVAVKRFKQRINLVVGKQLLRIR